MGVGGWGLGVGHPLKYMYSRDSRTKDEQRFQNKGDRNTFLGEAIVTSEMPNDDDAGMNTINLGIV